MRPYMVETVGKGKEGKRKNKKPPTYQLAWGQRRKEK